MRHKAHSLTPLLACLGAGLGIALAVHAPFGTAPEPAGSTARQDDSGGGAKDAGGKGAGAKEKPPEAAKLVRQAAERMESLPAVSAMLRQRVDLIGQKFHGAGQYWQQHYTPSEAAEADGPAKPVAACRFRLEFKYQVEDQTASLLAIGNDQAVWTYSKLLDDDGGYSVRLERIDVPRVLAAKAKDAVPKPDGYGFKFWAVGGLSQVLDGVSTMFEFREVRPVQLGGVPLWELRGDLNKSLLAVLLYDQREAVEQGSGIDYSRLPQSVPDQAVVHLGRDDLFPYRLAFLKRDQGEPREAVVVEYYEVDFQPRLEDQQFQFDPGTKKYTDRTKEYIEQRGVKEKK